MPLAPQDPSPQQQLERERLTREHHAYRRNVLTTVATVLAGFPIVAILLGGEVTAARNAVGLIVAEIFVLLAVVLARFDRIGAGVASLAVAIGVGVFDAHVVLGTSLTATMFPSLIVVLGFTLLPRWQATRVTAAMLLLIVFLRVAKLATGEVSEQWFGATIDPLTLALAIGALGWVHSQRVDRERAQLQQLISDLVSSQLRLEKARVLAEAHAHAAERASRTRSLFLSRVSHELRTPLNAILGYTELMIEDAEGDTELTEDLGRVQQAAHRQLDLVDDLLQLTQAQAGQIEVQAESIELEALITPILEEIEPLTRQNRTDLLTEIDPGTVRVDVGHSRRILSNLLSNAARFTEDGTIVASMRIVEGVSRELQIAVEDTGVGIAPERLPELFKPFTQGEACSADPRQGSGLGLAVVDALVNAMQGRRIVQSQPGTGTRVVIGLPIGEA